MHLLRIHVSRRQGALFKQSEDRIMNLPHRPHGSSRVMISKTGFGAWALGGGGWAFGWGPQDDDVSLATMRHALELGVNWIDTAAVYGLGHSEEVVGRPLRDM